jgi:DNA mismatch repair protein MSH5
MSLVARRHNYIRPILTHDNVLVINDGRHPLQELCVDQFIGNSLNMSSGMAECKSLSALATDLLAHTHTHTHTHFVGTIKIVSGPNFSGKSVYLKQNALISFMAHIGSFVPAESALVGLTDCIFSRVSSRDSILQAESTFYVDLAQIARMLRHASPRSLLVIDEFGKGTAAFGKLTTLHIASTSLQ